MVRFYKLHCIVIAIFLIVQCNLVVGAEESADVESKRLDYVKNRERIVEEEVRQRGPSVGDLTDAERRVNFYLDEFRNHDLSRVHEYQTSRHLINHDRSFQNGVLYKLFQRMPKGAILHAHAGAIQDLHSLVQFAVGRPDCYIFQSRPGEQSPLEGCFRIEEVQPSDDRWKRVVKLRSQCSDTALFDQNLFESLTLGNEDRNLDNIWNEFEQCWRRIGSLSDHPLVYRDFYRRELEAAVEANAQVLELRTFLDFPNRDGRSASPAEALRDLETLLSEVQQKNPEFRLRVIYSRERSASIPQIERYLTEAIQLRKDFPHLLAGFDLVGREETKRTLADLAPLLIQAKVQAERAGTTLPLFLHAGETAQRGFGNIVDAVLLDTSRIGHGLSLMDHPQVRAMIKSRAIPLEICPFSSYILGNINEISHHPARGWHRDGMCVTINPDDPGIMGSDLALDWYLVFVEWKLSLSELKQLVCNGIIGSSLPDAEKQSVMQEWEKRWHQWIAEIDREAQDPANERTGSLGK